MKRKYRNITVPYYYINNKKNIRGYIFKDKLYLEDNLYDLFKDFLGFYLDYHIEIEGKIIVAHSLGEVAELLLNNYKTFKISPKYKNDFSKREYEQFIKIQKYLKESSRPKPFETVIVKDSNINTLQKIKYYFQDYYYNKMIKEMKKYDYKIPTEVYSKSYRRNVYVVDGEPFWTLLSAFEYIYQIGFYYQYNGDGIDEYSEHSHQHDFEYVICDVIDNPNEFKIYDFQKKFFSKQEIIFLNALAQKLKDISYTSCSWKYENNYFYKGPLSNRYYKYRDNKQRIRTFLINKKIKLIMKRNKKRNLQNHKIKY